MSAMEILQSCLILLAIAHQLSWDFVSSDKIQCPELKFPNGRIRSKSKGRLVTFKCRKNFERVGPKFSVCLETGQWSQETPKCVGTTCPKLPLVPNLIVQELFRGGVLKFTCGARTIRSGPETIMCDGTKWSEQPPKCIAGTSLECDFEDDLLCRWSQDGDDDFDWTWHKEETPTAQTGPRFDHTLNSSKGHYIYMESSAPSGPGQKTRILSPSYAPDDMVDMCLEFYYHMFGPDASEVFGALDVYLKPQSVKTTMLNERHRIFHQAGSQGDHWQRANVKIPAMTETFQIVFQGTRLGSFLADIAIDDISLHGCTDETPTGGESTENEGDGKDTDDNVDDNAESSVQRKTTKKSVTTAKVTDQTTALPLKTSVKSFISSTVISSALSSTSKLKETTSTPTTVLSTKSTTEKQITTFVSTAAATPTTTAKTTTAPTTTTTTSTTTTPIIITRTSTAIKSTTATTPKTAKPIQATTDKTTQVTTAKTTQVTTAKTTELLISTLSKSTLATTKTTTKLSVTTPTSVIPTSKTTTRLPVTTPTSVIPTTKTTTKSPTSAIPTTKTTTKLPATTPTSVIPTTPKAPTTFFTTFPPTDSPTSATSPVTTTTNHLSDITPSTIMYDHFTDISEFSTENGNEKHYTTTVLSIVTDLSNENDHETIDNNGEDSVDDGNNTTSNRNGDEDSRATDEDDNDNSDKDKTMTTDVIDYDSSDVDSDDSLSSNSSALNRSQHHVTDHYPGDNQIQEDTTSAPNTNSDNANRADDLRHGAVKTQDQTSSSNTNEMLPLIIGVSSAVMVAAVVIAVLAYIWARNQRQKNEKEEEDQMNIITEYVETNLSI